MPNWIIYDTALTQNTVKQYLLSDPHDPTYPVGVNEGSIKDPNVSQVIAQPMRYWKVVSGSVVLMTAGEQNTVDAAITTANTLAVRAAAKAMLDGFLSSSLFQRAVADIIKDEINSLRGWVVSFKAQVALATNLANLQTRVAGLPDMPDRTLAQLKTAIKNRVDDGTVDS